MTDEEILKKADEIKKNKTKKKTKKPIQHTKIILNMTIALTIITTLASIYINLKNGLGLDSVVNSCWDSLKFIIPSTCAKSFFETKEEKKLGFLKELKDLAFDNNGNEIKGEQWETLMNLVGSQSKKSK